MGYSNYIDEIIGFWIGYVVMWLPIQNGATDGRARGARDQQGLWILRK